MKKYLLLACLVASPAFADPASKPDPKATVTLTYEDLSRLVGAAVAEYRAKEAQALAQEANDKLAKAFAPTAGK